MPTPKIVARAEVALVEAGFARLHQVALDLE
jgi:hypothetical protein